MMRRRFLVLTGSGLIVPLAPMHPARATPVQVAALIAELVGDATLRDERVKLDLPVMVENGNSVGMTVRLATCAASTCSRKAIRCRMSCAYGSARAPARRESPRASGSPRRRP